MDWHVLYNPLTWRGDDIKVTSTVPTTSGAQINLIDHKDTELFVPGIGLQRKERADVGKVAPQASSSLESIVQYTQALCVDSTLAATPNSCASRSMQRRLSLEQAPALNFRKRTSAKPSTLSLSSSPVRMEGSGGIQQTLFVGFSWNDDKAQHKGSFLRGRVRPTRVEGDGVGVRSWWSNGDQSSLDLQPTSIPISAKRERN